MKLALGTAQFGMKYGINNKSQIPVEEVYRILNFSLDNNLKTVDTAAAYGESERIIGDFPHPRKNELRIVSKCSSDKDTIKKEFKRSLEHLKTKKLYGLLIHNFGSFLKDKSGWEHLKEVKKNKQVEKIGFSLYHPEEIKYLLDNSVDFDLVQVPYNVFDQRFAPLFPILKQRGIEVHVRSVFLQGLVFKNPEELAGVFSGIRRKIKVLNSISQELKMPISALCLNFALANHSIDKVVIGVDSMKNLSENVRSIRFQKYIPEILEKLKDLKEDNERIILPINWNPTR